MLFELEPADVEEVVAAAPPDELDDCVDDVAAGVDALEVVELEEPDPQAATPRATRTSRTAVNRRVDLPRIPSRIPPPGRVMNRMVVVFISRSYIGCR
jgi:hypothetical protein